MAIGSTGVIFVAALCGIIALFQHHLKRLLLLYIKVAKFPGPRAFPIIDTLDKINDVLNTYSSPVRMWLVHRLLFFVVDPEQVNKILNSPHAMDKGFMYDFARPWLGTGLLTASGTKWRIRRKLIAPTFNMRLLESFVETLAKQATVMTRQMEKELESGEFDSHHYITHCVLNITCATTMGVKMNSQLKYNLYTDAVNGTSEAISLRWFHIWLHPDFIFNLTKLGRDQREHLKYLHSVTRNVIQMKKSSYNNETLVASETEHKIPATRKIFLDLLMDFSEGNKKLTEEEVCEEVNTMMAASFHTTAIVTTFATVMLANNPELQKRAYRELCDIYGDEVSSETPVKNEDLNRMKYLERVIKETLRLFPVSPIISRQINENLDIGGYTLPKGSSACIFLQYIHRSEKYWPDPLKFDPDRFLPEEVAKRNSFCYMPFSAGPRNCIGSKYAIVSIKVILATVLRRYILKKDRILDIKDIKLKFDLLKPTENMKIRISERVNESGEK